MATVVGTAFDDVLDGDIQNNSIFGLEGDDILAGFSGDDDINGGPGMDSIYGDSGDDLLLGGANDDFIYGDSGDDFVFGNFGSDLLYGNEGDDNVYGGQGNDNIGGESGNDFVSGDAGNDAIWGADIMASDPGSGEIDTLTGGSGADSFFIGGSVTTYYTADGEGDYALITDFNPSEFDAIVTHINDTYTLENVNLPGVGMGAGVFLTTGWQNELVAVVQGVDADDLSLAWDFVSI